MNGKRGDPTEVPPGSPAHCLPLTAHAFLHVPLLSTPELYPPRLHEAVVLAQRPVLLDLGDRIEENADDDQDRGAAEAGVGNAHPLGDQDRQQGDQGEKEATGQGDARQNTVDIIRRAGSRLHTRDESALLLQVLSQIDRIEDDRGVEVAEDQDQEPEHQVVGQIARLEEARQLGEHRILGEAGDACRVR